MAQAEDIDAARRRQADFEARPVERPVFTASPFAALGTAGEPAAALGFSASDGAGLLCSRTELLKVSLTGAPLDALALEPLVTADLHLPTHAHLHSVRWRQNDAAAISDDGGVVAGAVTPRDGLRWRSTPPPAPSSPSTRTDGCCCGRPATASSATRRRCSPKKRRSTHYLCSA